MYSIEPTKINESIIYRSKNSSNQIMNLIFTPYKSYNQTYWYVCFWIGKHKNGFQEFKVTGRSGLSSLLWAKKAIIDFISKVDSRIINHVCISWTDNKRRDAYLRGLSPLGFTKKRIDTQMVLHFKIN